MGPERHSDKVQRHAETKVSHMDICMEEKEHSKQRKQWGQGLWDGGPLGVFGKSKEASMSGAVIKVREVMKSSSDRAPWPW